MNRPGGRSGMAIPNVQASHDLSNVLPLVLPIPVNGQRHGETQMVAFYSLVHKIVDLQNSKRLGVDQESQVLDEMRPPSVLCEVNDGHFLLFVLIQEE